MKNKLLLRVFKLTLILFLSLCLFYFFIKYKENNLSDEKCRIKEFANTEIVNSIKIRNEFLSKNNFEAKQLIYRSNYSLIQKDPLSDIIKSEKEINKYFYRNKIDKNFINRNSKVIESIRKYEVLALNFNNKISSFPDNLIAKRINLNSLLLFEINYVF